MRALRTATTSEVYVTVTGARRRVRSIGRRALAVAVAAFALAAALLVISLEPGASTAGKRVVRAQPPAPTSTPARATTSRHAAKRPKLDADGDTDGLLPNGHFDPDDF
ncbi:MAG: hypothetical protein JO304_10580 [Solirubrobacterales bacterium]|nr:hypothetical protein [Solirubrobacterales bacterium]MBV9310614.1 hypothetical protein [Solirubrobacterales bacterium]